MKESVKTQIRLENIYVMTLKRQNRVGVGWETAQWVPEAEVGVGTDYKRLVGAGHFLGPWTRAVLAVTVVA